MRRGYDGKPRIAYLATILYPVPQPKHNPAHSATHPSLTHSPTTLICSHGHTLVQAHAILKYTHTHSYIHTHIHILNT